MEWVEWITNHPSTHPQYLHNKGYPEENEQTLRKYIQEICDKRRSVASYLFGHIMITFREKKTVIARCEKIYKWGQKLPINSIVLLNFNLTLNL